MLNKQYTSVERIQQGPEFTLAVSLESVRYRTLASHPGQTLSFYVTQSRVWTLAVSRCNGRGTLSPGAGGRRGRESLRCGEGLLL